MPRFKLPATMKAGVLPTPGGAPITIYASDGPGCPPNAVEGDYFRLFSYLVECGEDEEVNVVYPRPVVVEEPEPEVEEDEGGDGEPAGDLAAELAAMNFNEVRAKAKELGVSAAGKRADIEARILGA